MAHQEIIPEELYEAYCEFDDGLSLDRLEAVIARLALADPTRIAALRVAPCRFCWGEGHNYQWRTEREFQARVAEVEQNKKAIGSFHASDLIKPNDDGGYGYTKLAEPNEDCPECDGLGEAWVWLADHTKLRPHERALLNGIKQETDGRITVMMEKKSTYIKAVTDLLKVRMLMEDDRQVNDQILEILALAAPPPKL